MAQWVKDLALSLLWLQSLLWHRFDPWPGNFHMPLAWPGKKKIEREKERDYENMGLKPLVLPSVIKDKV